MRRLADASRLRRFLKELARDADAETDVYRHYDPFAQALAKIQRGHAKDLDDVAQMLRRGLVEPGRLRELFEAIEPSLFRYPAVDPRSFRRRLEDSLEAHARDQETGR